MSGKVTDFVFHIQPPDWEKTCICALHCTTLPKPKENHRSKFCCQDKLHRLYLSLWFPHMLPLTPPCRWLDFTGVLLLSPYLQHLEKKKLQYGTNIDKLLQKQCLNIWMLLMFYICVLYQHITGYASCTRVTGGDFSGLQRSLR